MINMSESAQNYFRHLLKTQGGDAIGIRVSAVHPGTPRADARLEFCESGDLLGDEWSLDCDGFILFVDAPSVRFLEGAEVDDLTQATGRSVDHSRAADQGRSPEAGRFGDRARAVPAGFRRSTRCSAAHKGQVSLEEVTPEGVVRLRFGGGCHGCGMVDVTLKQGIEKTLMERIPEITAVRDATDHATGEAPYIPR